MWENEAGEAVRSLGEQALNLSPAQRRALVDKLLASLEPAAGVPAGDAPARRGGAEALKDVLRNYYSGS